MYHVHLFPVDQWTCRLSFASFCSKAGRMRNSYCRMVILSYSPLSKSVTKASVTAADSWGESVNCVRSQSSEAPSCSSCCRMAAPLSLRQAQTRSVKAARPSCRRSNPSLAARYFSTTTYFRQWRHHGGAGCRPESRARIFKLNLT